MSYKGFNSVELRKPKRSLFDMSHEKRLTTRMGKLTPILIRETIPNDTFTVNSEVMLRLAPLLAPIMHRVNVYVHFFFVANRLLWEDWETFITNGRLGTETPPVPPNAYIHDVLAFTGNLFDNSSLADYLGVGRIPDSEEASWTGNRAIDLMPFFAHYKVWYDYYRDRNYIDDNDVLPHASGNESDINIVSEVMAIRNRDWNKDYFTSALPWTQRGDEVLMPLDASVTYLDNSLVYRNDTDTLVASDIALSVAAATPGELRMPAGGAQLRVQNIDSISNATITINDLRRAARLQEWLERNALAGSRYTESIWAHFNRKSSDGRLQRAEYLGGGKVTVKISEVVTTAFSLDETDATVPPANMAGHGLSFGNTNRFRYNCEEHGFIIGIMSVMPTSGYMQGSERMFFGRNTFLDYPWPSFAHLGEQPVYDYEIYTEPSNLPVDRTLQPVFGYQSRYVDWKNINSSSHGDFREGGSLTFWHLDREFTDTPVLDELFVNFEDTLQDRIFAVSGVDTLWCYIYNKVTVVRSLPYFGTPML